MILRLEFDVTEEQLKLAICCAWEKVFDTHLLPDAIKDFGKDYVMPENDLKNLLVGSSLAEIVDVKKHTLKRIL